MTRKFTVAAALELGSGFQRHIRQFQGIMEFAQQNDWDLVIDEFPQQSMSRSGQEPPYDGIIARATRAMAQASVQHRVPLVNIWLTSPVAMDLPGAFMDYDAAGKMHAEHLIWRGFKRFALLGNPGVAYKRMAAGIRSILAEAGFDDQEAIIPYNLARNQKVWRRTHNIMSKWIDRFKPPIGVIVFIDEAGRLTAQMCKHRGMRIPEEVAISAGGNEISYCESASPTLTSIEYGYARQGYEAARLLHRAMSGENIASTHTIIPPKSIVVRESTDFFAVDDELVSAALQFIAANSHHPIGPEQVAAALNVSASKLKPRFRKCMGRGIASQIRQTRLNRAKRELVQGDRSIAEIARIVGFGSRLVMYGVFRRELGMTPSAYRKQQDEADI